ncbi:hypothetical protein AKJ36_03295 [candidate division MSBL1 archaeon SCGC-AAA259I07]|uniref:Helix-turn-helix type 11 domain-containing protein n=1 Tax=candidate division MSBL1 archaeon SCGC-AAA259I07 TaxID=1698266 RepID=A0A133UJ35_9EURY|nr:hypothetical protein AKJ36_03295 [candidate division MSBL1 archaeon SCGC-AAA259I07]
MNSEEDRVEKDSLSPQMLREELILYLLRNYGDFQTKEIAKILGHEPRTIRKSLKNLEDSGKVESDKLGRGYIWSSSVEEKEGLMYF